MKRTYIYRSQDGWTVMIPWYQRALGRASWRRYIKRFLRLFGT